MLVENNRINAVGPGSQVPIPDCEVTQIDAQHGFMLPGGIDIHVHMMAEGLDLLKAANTPFSLNH